MKLSRQRLISIMVLVLIFGALIGALLNERKNTHLEVELLNQMRRCDNMGTRVQNYSRTAVLNTTTKMQVFLDLSRAYFLCMQNVFESRVYNTWLKKGREKQMEGI